MLASWIALATTLRLAAADAPLGAPVDDPLGAPPPPSRRIDTVVIVRHGALEGAKILTPADSTTYLMMEWLRDHVFHSRTSDATIRNRLILGAGDEPDSIRLGEAGRLLRLERFLADARVDTLRLDDGRLALRSESWDRWSTALIASLNRSGGEMNWALGLREANLLGTGQDVGFSYSSTALQHGWTFNYANTSLFAPGGQLTATYVDLNDGHNLVGSFGYPNRSRYQTWAWTVDFQDLLTERRILATPSVREHFTRLSGAAWTDDALFCTQPDSRYRRVHASVARYWGEETRLGLSAVAESELDSAGATRGAFTVDSSKLEPTRADPLFLAWRAPSPHRDDRRLGIGLSLRGLDYVRKRNFNQLKWTEDVPVGWQLTAAGYLNVLSRGEIRDDGLLQAGASWTSIAGNVYQSANATWKSYFGDEELHKGLSNAKLELRWIPSQRFQAIASVANDAIYGVPVYRSQISLGEDNGLPGYTARAFTGRGRFLSGTEIRWTPPLEALTVAPALAVFAGTGRVSDTPTLTGAAAWKTGVGFGLRFGMTRSPNGLVNHLSFSRPVGDPDHSGWLISFGAKQSL